MSNKAPIKESKTVTIYDAPKEYKTEDGVHFTTVAIYDAINKGDEWADCDITGLRRHPKTKKAEVCFEGEWYDSFSCGEEVEKLLKKEETAGE